MTTPTPRFHPPQQSRSQETLDRLLDAAEQVMATKSFNEATLAEIVEHAGVTVGAFYRRFPDKDALLHHLDQRFFAELHQRADTLFDEARWAGQPIAAIVRALADEATSMYRMRRGLLRSLFLRARVDPVIQATARQLNAHLLARFRTVISSRRSEIRHPEPDRAVTFGFMMLLGAIRETVIFGEVWPDIGAVADDRLPAELTRMYLAYLGVAG